MDDGGAGDAAGPRMPQQTHSGAVYWWTREQAAFLSTSQLSPSGCGPTAAVDVLQLLGLRADPGEVQAMAPARLRDYEAPILQYLLSRARAGTTHLDLIHAVQQLSHGHAQAAFFSPHHLTPGPQLARWLRRWMAAGAVPVLTMNLFLHGNDAWHHQVVYGVEPQRQQAAAGSRSSNGSGSGSECTTPDNSIEDGSFKVLLLNPLSEMSADSLVQVLATPPFMIIPRDHMKRKLRELLDSAHGSSGAVSSHAPAQAVGGCSSSRDGAQGPPPQPSAGPQDPSTNPIKGVLQLCSWLQATPPWSHFDVGDQLSRVLHHLLRAAHQPHEDPDRPPGGGPQPSPVGPSRPPSAASGPLEVGPGRPPGATTGYSRFSDLVIPWGGLAGITLFAPQGSEAHRWLRLAGACPPPGPVPTASAPDTGSCLNPGAQPSAASPWPGAAPPGVWDVALPLYPGQVARVQVDMWMPPSPGSS